MIIKGGLLLSVGWFSMYICKAIGHNDMAKVIRMCTILGILWLLGGWWFGDVLPGITDFAVRFDQANLVNKTKMILDLLRGVGGK